MTMSHPVNLQMQSGLTKAGAVIVHDDHPSLHTSPFDEKPKAKMGKSKPHPEEYQPFQHTWDYTQEQESVPAPVVPKMAFIFPSDDDQQSIQDAISQTAGSLPDKKEQRSWLQLINDGASMIARYTSSVINELTEQLAAEAKKKKADKSAEQYTQELLKTAKGRKLLESLVRQETRKRRITGDDDEEEEEDKVSHKKQKKYAESDPETGSEDEEDEDEDDESDTNSTPQPAKRGRKPKAGPKAQSKPKVVKAMQRRIPPSPAAARPTPALSLEDRTYWKDLVAAIDQPGFETNDEWKPFFDGMTIPQKAVDTIKSLHRNHWGYPAYVVAYGSEDKLRTLKQGNQKRPLKTDLAAYNKFLVEQMGLPEKFDGTQDVLDASLV